MDGKGVKRSVVRVGKVTILISLMLVMLFVFTQSAFAGGWSKATSSDPIGDVYLENDASPTPHLNFSSTTNRCRICHAVHLANENSWRLLKSGNTTEPRSPGEGTSTGMGSSRDNECMYCHDADSGITAKRPYGYLFGYTIRGEHSLGATWIPDSNVNEDTGAYGDGKGVLPRGGKLDCYQCHTVHGGGRLTNIVAWGWGNASEPIDNYILRNDPAGNGGNATDGVVSVQPPPGGWNDPDQNGKADDVFPTTDTTPYDPASEWRFEVMDAWCGDCHNLNPNITAPNDIRPNVRSHPLFGGPNSTDTTGFTGGEMEAYDATIQVSGGAPKGCDGCHMSGQKNVQPDVVDDMSWPHQAEGNKFLIYQTTETTSGMPPFESYLEGSKSGPGDSFRVVPYMDAVCIWCHQWYTTMGVGRTF